VELDAEAARVLDAQDPRVEVEHARARRAGGRLALEHALLVEVVEVAA